MPRTFVFLGGNSYPADAGIEARLRSGLVLERDCFIGQQALLDRYAEGQFLLGLQARQAMLRQALAECATPARRIVLIGRSSGARVASLLAAAPGGLNRVGALVLLAYPFRPPGTPPDPSRYAHLAALRVPTLLLQGRADPYGGAEVAERHALSPTIQLHLLPADHALEMPAAAWAEAVAAIARFLGD